VTKQKGAYLHDAEGVKKWQNSMNINKDLESLQMTR
jgi:hypothetical protein